MNDDQKEKLVVAATRVPTKEELEIEAYFAKSKVSSIENLQQALTRMITLSASLAAGSVAFLRDALDANSQIAVAAFLIFSLILAVIGSTPIDRGINEDIQSKKDAIERIKQYRQSFLIACLFFFILALIIAVWSMVTHVPDRTQKSALQTYMKS